MWGSPFPSGPSPARDAAWAPCVAGGLLSLEPHGSPHGTEEETEAPSGEGPVSRDRHILASSLPSAGLTQKQETPGAAMRGLALGGLRPRAQCPPAASPQVPDARRAGDEVWPCAAGWPAEAA